jgi:hypothetical protein
MYVYLHPHVHVYVCVSTSTCILSMFHILFYNLKKETSEENHTQKLHKV